MHQGGGGSGSRALVGNPSWSRRQTQIEIQIAKQHCRINHIGVALGGGTSRLKTTESKVGTTGGVEIQGEYSI